MNNMNEAFIQFIKTLSSSESEKTALLDFGARYQKEILRLDFQVKRTVKDKSIMINLLNRTIDELQIQQREVVCANEALRHQKQLVEEQSAKLAEQLTMLEKSYAELEQFSYIASHDLKSPLRTISSYAGLLKRRYSDHLDADAKDFIDYIMKGTCHMNEIIRDLLEYGGISKSVNFEPLELSNLVDLVKQNLTGEINESKAIIEQDELPVITGYQTGLLQLFQNLLANAIKFRGAEQPKIAILAADMKQHWQFTVSDNGLGLDESYQEKAFMPFQRISHLDRPGTGMGLAICKKIVKMHNGEIWYNSALGKGTNFHFTLSKKIQ